MFDGIQGLDAIEEMAGSYITEVLIYPLLIEKKGLSLLLKRTSYREISSAMQETVIVEHGLYQTISGEIAKYMKVGGQTPLQKIKTDDINDVDDAKRPVRMFGLIRKIATEESMSTGQSN